MKFIPETDLRVIDGLWRSASNGKFGYSVQKELWVQNRRYWERLFKAIDWTHGEHNYYRCLPASSQAICAFGHHASQLVAELSSLPGDARQAWHVPASCCLASFHNRAPQVCIAMTEAVGARMPRHASVQIWACTATQYRL